MKCVQLEMDAAQPGIDVPHLKMEPEQLTIELKRRRMALERRKMESGQVEYGSARVTERKLFQLCL